MIFLFEIWMKRGLCKVGRVQKYYPNKLNIGIIMLSSVKCFLGNNKMINQRMMKKRIS